MSPKRARPGSVSRIITPFVRVLDSPDDPACRAEPFTAALGDLMDRLGAMASGQQIFRFLSAVRGYFLAQFWEAGHRANGRPAGLAEYEAMRRHSGAVPTVHSPHRCRRRVRVSPTKSLCRRDVRAATDIAVNVTCWANDILSFPKESARSLTVHSLPAVLSHERRLPWAEAIKVAASMHDAEVVRYLEAEESLRRNAMPELCQYLDGLRNWMGGNLRWSQETGRYDPAAATQAGPASQTCVSWSESGPRQAPEGTLMPARHGIVRRAEATRPGSWDTVCPAPRRGALLRSAGCASAGRGSGRNRCRSSTCLRRIRARVPPAERRW